MAVASANTVDASLKQEGVNSNDCGSHSNHSAACRNTTNGSDFSCDELARMMTSFKRGEETQLPSPNLSNIDSAARIETDADDQLQTERRQRLRRLVASARKVLNEQATETQTTAVEPARFEIKWEKALRQSRTDKDSLCSKIAELGELDDPRSVRMLTHFAQAKQKRVRFETAKALRNVGTSDALNLLLSLLKDPKPKVARAAMIGLVRNVNAITLDSILAYGVTGPTARAGLLRELQRLDSPGTVRELLFDSAGNDDGEIGVLALQAAGRLAGTSDVSRIAAFANHHSAEFRRVALEELIRTKNQQVVRFLNQSLSDDDDQVRAIAAAGLSRWSTKNSGDRLLKLIGDPSGEVRRSAARSLRDNMKPAFAKQLLPALQTEQDTNVLVLLIDAVGRSGASGISKDIYPFTRRPGTEVRIAALTALTRLKDKRAQPALVRLLSDSNAFIRQKAVDGLGIKGNTTALDELEQVLKGDREPAVRAAAARAMGTIESVDAERSLSEAMDDESTVRCQAVIALKRIGSLSAVPILLDRLRDSAPEVRYNAVVALGALDARDASRDVLRGMLEDSDEMVQRAVHKTLTEFGVSVSSDLMKRRFQRVARKVKGRLPSLPIVGGITLTVCLVFGVFFARQSLGLTYEKPLLVLDVTDAAISPDGRHVVLVRSRGVLDLWSVQTGKLLTRFAPETAPNGILFPLDSQKVHLLGNGTDRVWDFERETLPQSGTLSFPGVQRVLLTNHDRSTVLTATGPAGTPLLWDKQRQPASVRLSPEYNLGRAISPDGKQLAGINKFNEIGLFSLPSGKKEAGIRLNLNDRPGTVTSLAFSPDARAIAIGFSFGEVSVLDLGTGELRTLTDKGSRVTRLNWLPDQLVAVHESEVSFFANGEQRSETIAIELNNIDKVSITADGATMLLGDTESRDVVIVDNRTRQVRWTFEGVDNE